MRHIRWIGTLAAVCLLAASAAAYQPAPVVVPTYEGPVIPSFRGQACSMPVTFAPGPICGEGVLLLRPRLGRLLPTEGALPLRLRHPVGVGLRRAGSAERPR